VPYMPTFEGPIQGYIANNIQPNLWKWSPLYEREDMMQEGYLVFVRCAGKYPNLDTPQHFMALFKMAWSRHCVDLAKKATKARAQVSATVVDDEGRGRAREREAVGDHDNDGALLTLLRQAPREVIMVLNLLINAPTELLELAQQSWDRRQKRGKGDPEQFIAQCLGLPEDSRPLQAVKEYLTD
jgi:hypothetical protein